MYNFTIMKNIQLFLVIMNTLAILLIGYILYNQQELIKENTIYKESIILDSCSVSFDIITSDMYVFSTVLNVKYRINTSKLWYRDNNGKDIISNTLTYDINNIMQYYANSHPFNIFNISDINHALYVFSNVNHTYSHEYIDIEIKPYSITGEMWLNDEKTPIIKKEQLEKALNIQSNKLDTIQLTSNII
jgi:hypothetical protein